MANEAIKAGRLLRSGIPGFAFGCRITEDSSPAFGALVRVPLADNIQIYGLVHDIHVDDDGLVRQLVTAEQVDEEVIQDNRLNRNVPMEISVISVGYSQGDAVRHLLPPRPPLSLDSIYECTDDEIFRFTTAGHFGYFRHILRNQDLPVSEIFAAHIQQAQAVHVKLGSDNWANQAARELITLLRDDYEVLMEVLSAMSDALPENIL